MYRVTIERFNDEDEKPNLKSSCELHELGNCIGYALEMLHPLKYDHQYVSEAVVFLIWWIFADEIHEWFPGYFQLAQKLDETATKIHEGWEGYNEVIQKRVEETKKNSKGTRKGSI